MSDIAPASLRSRAGRRIRQSWCTILLAGLSMSCSTTPTGTDMTSVSYICADAGEIRIARSTGSSPPTITLSLEGETAVLPQVAAASGSKYSDGNLNWWEKGDSGFIMRGDSIALRDCREAS